MPFPDDPEAHCPIVSKLFLDHRDTPAFIVFDSKTNTVALPPLYGFVIYFTHKELKHHNMSPVVFRNTVDPDGDLFEVRLDLHCYPNARTEDCVKHYKDEMEARGINEVQTNIVEKALELRGENPSAEIRTLTIQSVAPGLVPQYFDPAKKHQYNTVLYIVEDLSWRSSPEAIKVKRVEFDPVIAENGATLTATREDYVWMCPAGLGSSRSSEQECLHEDMNRFKMDQSLTELQRTRDALLKGREWKWAGWPAGCHEPRLGPSHH